MIDGELARVAGARDVYADFYRAYAERFRKRSWAPEAAGQAMPPARERGAAS